MSVNTGVHIAIELAESDNRASGSHASNGCGQGHRAQEDAVHVACHGRVRGVRHVVTHSSEHSCETHEGVEGGHSLHSTVVTKSRQSRPHCGSQARPRWGAPEGGRYPPRYRQRSNHQRHQDRWNRRPDISGERLFVTQTSHTSRDGTRSGHTRHDIMDTKDTVTVHVPGRTCQGCRRSLCPEWKQCRNQHQTSRLPDLWHDQVQLSTMQLCVALVYGGLNVSHAEGYV